MVLVSLCDLSKKTLSPKAHISLYDCPTLAHTLHELRNDTTALNNRPWRTQPQYFTQVLISTLALVKMNAYANMGGAIEVMGMLTGKIVRNLFVVLDVYLLPVEGTETRVNAQSDAYEYMVQYLDLMRAAGIDDSIVGWYHLHPGYGCWLSGIDVATQSLNQNFQDPYLAIVLDPVQTANQKKIEIGAFRTFPVGHDDNNNMSRLGARKKRDLGAHSKLYYLLDVRLFKSPQDEALVDQILHKSWSSNLTPSKRIEMEYQRRLRMEMRGLSEEIQLNIGQIEARVNSRFNVLFESMVLHFEHGDDKSGPVFAGLVSASIEEEVKEDLVEIEKKDLGSKDHKRNENDKVDGFNNDDQDEEEDNDDKDDDDEDDLERQNGEEEEEEEDLDDKTGENEDENNGPSKASYFNFVNDMKSKPNLITKLEGLGSEMRDRSVVARSQTILLRSDQDPIRLDSESALGSFDFSTSDRKRSGNFNFPTDAAEIRHRMQKIVQNMKRKKEAAVSISHSEIVDLMSDRAKWRIFGAYDPR